MNRLKSTFGMLAMGCALILTACTPAATSGGGPAPPGMSAPEIKPGVLAPLAGTHVDDEAIRAAWITFDAGLSVVDALRAVGAITDGSPKAKSLADALDGIRRWLNAATEAQQLGQQPSADAAFMQAEAAYSAFLTALGK